MQNYESLVERIAKASGLVKDEVERRVEAKKAKLSGLISKEGAAQIIAAELGISFENLDLKINELMPGMRKINVVGKVINIFPVREYDKNGRSGKVANLIIADDTGSCRIVLWDTKHISLIENQDIIIDTVVEVKNGAMRESEIHLSSFSDLIKSSKILKEVKAERTSHEKKLNEINVGETIKTRGVIVQVFDPRFFKVCPECNKKATLDSENFICVEHGQIIPKEKAILNFVLDDGTESIRCVLFSDAIAKISNEEDLKDAAKLAVLKEDLLGTEVFVSGNIRKNALFGNAELIASNIEKVDVEAMIEVLEKK